MDALNGAGLAAPQIGVQLRVVIFGVARNPRYPNAEPVPYTVLINPIITPLARCDGGGLGRLPVACPGMRGLVPRYAQLRYQRLRPVRCPDRSQSGRLPRARGAARVRSPRRHPLSDAHPRHAQLRLSRRAVPRSAGNRRLTQQRMIEIARAA